MRIKNTKPYKLKKPIYEKDDELNDILVGYEQIGTIMANIQPCSGVEKAQMYGTEITKYLSVICDPYLSIKEDLYIEVEGINYKIGPIYKYAHFEFDIKAVL